MNSGTFPIAAVTLGASSVLAGLIDSVLDSSLPLVILEGSSADWVGAAAVADHLADVPAIIVGLCDHGGDAELDPAAAAAVMRSCDLAMLVQQRGAPADPQWNCVTGTREAALEWASRIVERARVAPIAALACARLLRATADGPASAAVVGEAFAYSVLQGGPEHAHWLEARL
jgi:hypothetical protein